MTNRKVEVTTENLFREYYGANTFIEKSAIDRNLGFKSKNNSDQVGYPDFFLDTKDFAIVVEAKSTNIKSASSEVKHYMTDNNINKDIIGIAFAGQDKKDLSVELFLRLEGTNYLSKIFSGSNFQTLEFISELYKNNRYGDTITYDLLNNTLNGLNKIFHKSAKVKDTERSLFFSGIMIALKDATFRATYKSMGKPENPSKLLSESDLLNSSIIDAITRQLEDKVNTQSKLYSWRDRFSFIKNVDFSLIEYKEIISIIERNIFSPFSKNEKLDILGRAYKTFLKRAGKVENKNIILTPDHIKSLMIDIANLNLDDVVIDTCTGTGGFLMEAMEVLIELAGDDQVKIGNIKSKQLIGFENDPVLFALACSNMFLHGDGKTNLIFRSSLLENNKIDDELFAHIKQYKPTKAIINPPYENNLPIQFVLQAIDFLENNGILVAIMPTPTLRANIRSGLTQKLFTKATLQSMIRMPLNLFSEQNRTVNTSIFVFSKTPHKKLDEVLFVDLEDDGHVSIQHKGRIDKNDKWETIKISLLDIIHNRKELTGVSEMLKIFDDDSGISVYGSKTHKVAKSNLRYEKFKTLFYDVKGTLSSENSVDGEYPFITGSGEWKTHNEYSHDGEYLVYVVSASGSLGRCHYINGKFIASNLCLILKPKAEFKINLKFYHHYFNSIRKNIVKATADGTSKLTIIREFLLEYDIEYFDISQQNVFVENYYSPLMSEIQSIKIKIENMQETCEKKLDNMRGASSI